MNRILVSSLAVMVLLRSWLGGVCSTPGDGLRVEFFQRS
jgi:hypothetical protein